jgi:hypothetical protein
LGLVFASNKGSDRPQGNYLAVNLNAEIKFQNFIIEAIDASVYAIPFKDPKIIAFGFTPLSTPISVSVWDPPTKKSELPLKLPMLRILSYSLLSRL